MRGREGKKEGESEREGELHYLIQVALATTTAIQWTLSLLLFLLSSILHVIITSSAAIVALRRTT